VYEHTVLYYDDEARVLDLVAHYVAAGLDAGDRVLVALRGSRLPSLERLLHPRLDVVGARDEGRLHLFDAARTLDLFMVDGSPDPDLFRTHVAAHVTQPLHDGTPVRVMGEMVAVLWDEGNVAGAIELEALWTDLFERVPFDLLCAYPASALTGTSLVDIGRVCHLHSSVRPPAGYESGESAAVASDHRSDVRTAVFLPVVESVPATRGFVTGVLRSWNLTDQIWEASLVASELANNAIRHGASPFRVLVARTAHGARIGIQDVAPGRPMPRSATHDDIDGRGMTIVSALSEGWGCEQLTDGKFTWAELALASA
jgi:anti-sigma regulatory factor (Ser/Thr protein kinase)